MFLTRSLWTLCARLAAAGLVIGTAACTGGVVPGDAYDRPLQWGAALIQALPSGSHPVMGVIWTDPLQRRGDVLMPSRWIASTVTSAVSTGPDGLPRFNLQIFRPPPREALVEIAAPKNETAPAAVGETALAAVGEIVIVDDVDGDGTFAITADGNLAGDLAGDLAGSDGSSGDTYLAGTDSVLFYVARAFSAPIAGNLGPYDRPGYQMISYNCLGRLVVDYSERLSVLFEVQPSRTFIERRSCMRTHTP